MEEGDLQEHNFSSASGLDFQIPHILIQQSICGHTWASSLILTSELPGRKDLAVGAIYNNTPSKTSV